MTIGIAEGGEDLGEIRRLFSDYAAALEIDLGFQGFARELESLPGLYAPPRGRLLLAREDGVAVGCIALRPRTPTEGEVKRLYLDPRFRGRGIARRLVGEVLAAAEEIGYRSLVLDTLASMAPAIALYESCGFRRIPAYYDNPHPAAVYFRKLLPDPRENRAAPARPPHRLRRPPFL